MILLESIIRAGGNIRLEPNGKILVTDLTDEQRAALVDCKDDVIAFMTRLRDRSDTEAWLPVLATNADRIGCQEFAAACRQCMVSGLQANRDEIVGALKILKEFVKEIEGIGLSHLCREVFEIKMDEVFA